MVRRRVIAVVASAGLALVGLTGCRLEVGAAAYVGNTAVTQTQVDDVVARLKADGVTSLDSNRARARQEIMGQLLFLTVAKRYAAERGYGTPAVDYQAASDQIGLPTSDLYVRDVAEGEAYRQLLLARTAPVSVTEDDYRAMYRLLTAQGVNAPYEQLKPQLQQITGVPTGLGLQKQLDEAVARYRVQVNPVFGPVQFPLVQASDSSGQRYTLIALSMGSTASPAVVDVQPQASAQP